MVTVDWRRGFINVDYVALLHVLFDLFVRKSHLVCDPLGQVVDYPIRDWLVKQLLEEVGLFSAWKSSVEALEAELGQNIPPKPPDSRIVFICSGEFVPAQAVVSVNFVVDDGNRRWRRCIDDCLGSVAVRIGEEAPTVCAVSLVNPGSLVGIRRWTGCAFVVRVMSN